MDPTPSPALAALGVELTPDERLCLQGHMRRASFAADEVLCREGEARAGLCVVEQGELRVEVGGVPLAHVGPGAWVGEVALLDPGPASATVRAAVDCTVLELDAAALERLVAQEPHIARAVVRALSSTLARRLRQASQHGAEEGEGEGGGDEPPRTARSWLSRLFGGRRGA